MRREDIRPDRQEEIGILDPVMGDVALPEKQPVGLRYGGVGIDLELGEPLDPELAAERIDQKGEGAGGPSGQEEVFPPGVTGSGEGFRHQGKRLLPGNGLELPVAVSQHGGFHPLRMIEAGEGGLPADTQAPVVYRMTRHTFELDRPSFPALYRQAAACRTLRAGGGGKIRLSGDDPLFRGQNGGDEVLRLPGPAGRQQGRPRQYPQNPQKIPSLHPLRSLYLWQVVQSRGAPLALWQETHHPIVSAPTLRIFFMVPTFPWHSEQSTPALTCLLWEK